NRVKSSFHSQPWRLSVFLWPIPVAPLFRVISPNITSFKGCARRGAMLPVGSNWPGFAHARYSSFRHPGHSRRHYRIPSNLIHRASAGVGKASGPGERMGGFHRGDPAGRDPGGGGDLFSGVLEGADRIADVG